MNRAMFPCAAGLLAVALATILPTAISAASAPANTEQAAPAPAPSTRIAQVEVTALAAHVRRHYRLSPIPGRAIRQVGGIVQSLPEGIPARVTTLAPPRI